MGYAYICNTSSKDADTPAVGVGVFLFFDEEAEGLPSVFRFFTIPEYHKA